MSDEPDAYTCNCNTTNTYKRQTIHAPPPPPMGFEPTVSAGDRPQTHVLDRAATGTDIIIIIIIIKKINLTDIPAKHYIAFYSKQPHTALHTYCGLYYSKCTKYSEGKKHYVYYKL
jgi:hypothetical protein